MARLQSAIEHPGFMFMRAVSRFDSMRNTIACVQRVAQRGSYRKLLSQTDSTGSVFKTVDVDSVVSGLNRDGFATGFDLPSDILEQIKTFAEHATFYADRNPTLGFKPVNLPKARKALGRDFLIAQCFNVAAQCSAIRRLETDPKLLLIAAKYLKTNPVSVGTNLWWSYPVQADAASRNFAAQLFHYDLDDYAFVKFFFYLTDVDSESGPHVCVRATHRRKRFKAMKDRFLVRRYSDDEIRETYGSSSLQTFVGKAGTGFAEDTLCIHKGEPARKTPRLLLQFQYAINDHGNQHDCLSPERLQDIQIPA